eukprot:jgi/Botrbrau1/1110/Bobra.0162s0011.1
MQHIPNTARLQQRTMTSPMCVGCPSNSRRGQGRCCKKHTARLHSQYTGTGPAFINYGTATMTRSGGSKPFARSPTFVSVRKVKKSARSCCIALKESLRARVKQITCTPNDPGQRRF